MHFVFLVGSYIRSHNWIASVTCNAHYTHHSLPACLSLLCTPCNTHTFVCVRRPTINSRLVFCNDFDDLKIHSCTTSQRALSNRYHSARTIRGAFLCRNTYNFTVDASALPLHVPALNGIYAVSCIHVRQSEILRCIFQPSIDRFLRILFSEKNFAIQNSRCEIHHIRLFRSKNSNVVGIVLQVNLLVSGRRDSFW